MLSGGEAQCDSDIALSLVVMCADGRILSVGEAGGGKAGDVVADLMFPIHSGQIASLPGRILICITGMVVVLLSATGVYIWWKKRAGRTSGRQFEGEAFAALHWRRIHAPE